MKNSIPLEKGFKFLWAIFSYMAFFLIICFSLVYVIIPVIHMAGSSHLHEATEVAYINALIVYSYHFPLVALCLVVLCLFTKEVFYGYSPKTKLRHGLSLLIYTVGFFCVLHCQSYVTPLLSNLKLGKDPLTVYFVFVMVLANYIGLIGNRLYRVKQVWLRK